MAGKEIEQADAVLLEREDAENFVVSEGNK